jgi:glycosyltransferase involved in cell wall biosynthesis
MLVIGITMNAAGTEKSFVSFANCLDYGKYDVELLLAKREGLFLDLIPKEITVKVMDEYGDMFLMSKKNVVKTLMNEFVKRNPPSLFDILPSFIKQLLHPKERSFIASNLWSRLCKKYFNAYNPETEYDVAVAYWGDRTMFYMCDKIRAKKKITWLHFDYSNPPRDDKLYTEYFLKCDKIVCVSDVVADELKRTLPVVADRCTVMENIQNPAVIWDWALRGTTFTDTYFNGTRLLSIIRLSSQKGIDMIPEILRNLVDAGYDVRWYIVGDGDENDKIGLISSAFNFEVADRLVLLGTTPNPYSYLRDCDIYVQPSRYEGKPITVEEAKIMYKPIVAARYLSAEEQLNGGEFCVITDISADALGKGIKKLLDDANLCDRFTERLAKENFGNASEIYKFYNM